MQSNHFCLPHWQNISRNCKVHILSIKNDDMTGEDRQMFFYKFAIILNIFYITLKENEYKKLTTYIQSWTESCADKCLIKIKSSRIVIKLFNCLLYYLLKIKYLFTLFSKICKAFVIEKSTKSVSHVSHLKKNKF